jgi:hypothetical protein
MKLVPTIAATALGIATLSACGGTSNPAADPTSPASLHASQAAASSAPATPPPSRSGSPSSSPRGQANMLDPCHLVTQAEASTLAHATFGPGKEEGNAVRHTCVYGAQTPNVLMIFALQGASTEDAQTEWNQLLAQAKAGAGQAADLVQLTPDSGIADRAEWVELNLAQIGVSGRGLAFLKGSVGVYMIDEVRGGSAPSRAAFTDQATTVLGRLP